MHARHKFELDIIRSASEYGIQLPMHAQIVLMALMQVLYWISKLVIEWQEGLCSSKFLLILRPLQTPLICYCWIL